jgi:hypothetical protein
MKIKKIGLFATMAVAAMALALPAAASAWTEKGEPLAADVTINVTGSAAFSGTAGGVNCTHTTATMHLNKDGTGAVSVFAPQISSCHLTGGLASVCTKLTSVTNENTTGGKWAVDNKGTDAEITGVKIQNHLEGGFFCPKTITLGTGNVTVTPDPNTTAIESLTLGGQLPVSTGGNVAVSGTISPVNAGDKGTYGL